MSHTITSRKEIPDAPCYVLSNDTFMSGWGQADGKVNTVILPCESRLEAETVALNAKDRTDQQRIRIVADKPRLRRGVLYSLLTKENGAARWYQEDRPFAQDAVRRLRESSGPA